MTIHQRVEEIEKHLAELPERETFYRGIPISNFSHDALVAIAGEFLACHQNSVSESREDFKLLQFMARR
jgi:hypothetical protein